MTTFVGYAVSVVAALGVGSLLGARFAQEHERREHMRDRIIDASEAFLNAAGAGYARLCEAYEASGQQIDNRLAEAQGDIDAAVQSVPRLSVVFPVTEFVDGKLGAHVPAGRVTDSLTSLRDSLRMGIAKPEEVAEPIRAMGGVAGYANTIIWARTFAPRPRSLRDRLRGAKRLLL